MIRAQVARLLERHEASGRRFSAAGIGSCVLDECARNAPPVVCVHGVPASAFLYRKVVPALARRGLRGIAIDLPGLGLAERPADADYTWSGLSSWLLSAIDALHLERFHLLVHDIGGPIGFDVASAVPDRVLSMTLLNTIIAVERFHRPWPMEPFAHSAVGEVWLESLHIPGTFESIMRLVGVSSRIPTAEISCWKPLLFGEDRGRAFLKIMRGFELTWDNQRRYTAAVRDARYPVQIVWGIQDRMLSWHRYGSEAQHISGTQRVMLLPAKHFVPEDCPEDIATVVYQLAQSR